MTPSEPNTSPNRFIGFLPVELETAVLMSASIMRVIAIRKVYVNNPWGWGDYIIECVFGIRWVAIFNQIITVCWENGGEQNGSPPNPTSVI